MFRIIISTNCSLGIANFILTLELNGFGYPGNNEYVFGTVFSNSLSKEPKTLFCSPGVPCPDEKDQAPAISLGISGEMS